jgi:hypothetical protein
MKTQNSLPENTVALSKLLGRIAIVMRGAMALPSFCLRVKSPSVASSNGLDAVIAVAILGSQGWFGGDCESLCDSLEWQTTATHDHYFCFYDWACAWAAPV